MFQTLHFLVALMLLIAPFLVFSRDIVQLEGFNFELTSTMHRYLAVLFYDTSPEGEKLRELWKATADLIHDDQFTNDSEIGMVRIQLILPLSLLSKTDLAILCRLMEMTANFKKCFLFIRLRFLTFESSEMG
jgi:hypothetical protein